MRRGVIRRWKRHLTSSAVVTAGTAALVLAGVLSWAPPAMARDILVTSFDGTHLVVHFFPAAGLAPGERAPTVMVGPGWAVPADTDPYETTDPLGGTIGIGTLRQAGYNVVTWEPRGFGGSGGTVEVDSPSYEGRDVSALIDFVARQPEASLDGPNDPRVGMAGGSYGGGIQLVAAAVDHRIDAIVPDIAWNSLQTSLYKQDTVKTGWSDLLYAAAAGDPLDLHIRSAYQEAQSGGPLSAGNVSFFQSRGPGDLVRRIRAPTLLIQGTVDDLFTLQEAVVNYRELRHNGVPTKMLWFCGGHGDCDVNAGDTGRIERDTLAWLARYLKGQRSLATGPGFEWVDQNGRSYSAPTYPLPAGRPLTGEGSGTLQLRQSGGSGPLVDPRATNVLALAADSAAPTKAVNAVNVSIGPSRTNLVLVGPPVLSFDYRGTAPRPATRVLAQIVDDATGKVLGNQITPVPVRLDGASRSVKVPLEIIAAGTGPGLRFTLQLVANSTAYDVRPAGGSVRFTHIRVQLPSVRGARS